MITDHVEPPLPAPPDGTPPEPSRVDPPEPKPVPQPDHMPTPVARAA